MVLVVVGSLVVDILQIVAPLLAPLVSGGIVLLLRGWWLHEQRIRSLERANSRLRRTIYGDEDDHRHTGLARDVADIHDRLDSDPYVVDSDSDDTDE
jgi:hypothetical protein